MIGKHQREETATDEALAAIVHKYVTVNPWGA